MGCDGCELYPSLSLVRKTITNVLQTLATTTPGVITAIENATGLGQQHVRLCVHNISQRIAAAATADQGLQSLIASQVVEETTKLFVCYAADMHRSFNPGGANNWFAHPFEKPRLFPGRVATAALMPPPKAAEIADKPWLKGYRRLIFVSDMGDALSRDVPFDYLLQEVIVSASSTAGSRHIWLWLTKRPKRMAEFSAWLSQRRIDWPDNLVPMTTVTGPETLRRIDHLLSVKARFRGLSLEPLWGPVSLPLDGINWVIVGGQSGDRARPFNLEWARQVRDGCRIAATAFFVKQLGRQPTDNGQPLQLTDSHGGDWAEWPVELRVRQLPCEWCDQARTA